MIQVAASELGGVADEEQALRRHQVLLYIFRGSRESSGESWSDVAPAGGPPVIWGILKRYVRASSGAAASESRLYPAGRAERRAGRIPHLWIPRHRRRGLPPPRGPLMGRLASQRLHDPDR